MSVQQQIANVSAVAGGTGGIFMFLSDNAPVFGLMLTVVSIGIAWRYYHLNYKLNYARLRIAIEDSEKGVPQVFTEADLKMYKKVAKWRVKRAKKGDLGE